MIKLIESKIEEKLIGLGAFEGVSTFLTSKGEGFPYVGFELLNIKTKKIDNCTNEKTIQFGLLIFQETSRAGREKGKDIMYGIFEVLMNAFDQDETLGGLVDGSEITELSMNDGLDDNKGKGLYGSVILSFNTTINLNDV